MPEKALTAEEKAAAKQSFDHFDKDKSGNLSEAEFASAIKEIGLDLTPAELKKNFEFADKDKSGSINFDEYMKVLETRPLKRRLIKELFEELDTDKSGSIDAKDIKEVLTKAGYTYTDDEIKKLVALADKSGDGKIDFPEFEAAMNKLLDE